MIAAAPPSAHQDPAAPYPADALPRVRCRDASRLAVLVGPGPRAGLLGGFLHLAAPAPAVARVLRVTGLHRRLDVFPTVQAAITGPGARPAPAGRHSGRVHGYR